MKSPKHETTAPTSYGMAPSLLRDILRVQEVANQHSKFDTPSHTLTPFIPPSAQTAYLALRSLNIETSRIPDTTSQPTIANLRIQFWRDAISSALAYTPRKEPVEVLLSAAAAQLADQTEGRGKLSKSWLLRIINERETYIAARPWPDIRALENYAEGTYSTLLYLTLQAMGFNSVTADHLASHVGKAQGIVAVLRGLPLLAFPPPAGHHGTQQPGAAQQGVVTLPLDVMAKHGLREHEVLKKGADAAGLRDAVFEVATRASDHLITVREMLRNLRSGQDVGHDFEHGSDEGHQDREEEQGVSAQAAEAEQAFGALMHAVPTQRWLDRLQKVDFDVFQPKLRTGDWALPMRAYWAFSRRSL